MIRKAALFCFFILFTQHLLAQKTSIYTEINTHYKEGLRLFSEGVYMASKKEFEAVLNDPHLSFEPEYSTLKMYAEYYSAISALRMKLESSDLMVTEFIKKHRPDPIAEKANLEVANYHFDQKNYNEALVYYKLMDTRGMPAETLAEIRFKEGYTYFAKKDFKSATTAFLGVKDIKGEYYYPVNYYLGLSHYFNGKYNEAIASFDVAAKSKKYADIIPYYITQIYFSQGQHDKLIAYAKPFLEGTQKVDKTPLIERMVGHSYFLKKDYTKALQFLEKFEKTNQTLEESDYYALGYSNYTAGNFDKAIPYFAAISGQQNQLGQNSNYYLADCYLKSGNTLSARTAFYNVSKLPYQEAIRTEALFNYGKLSAELGFDRESITALHTFTAESKYYTEAQNIMGDVLERTKDYDNALRTIEAIKAPSQRLKQAYQQLAYRRALQLVQEDRPGEARVYLNKAMEPSYDRGITTSSMYWMADLAQRQQDYDLSNEWATKFLAAVGTTKDASDPSLIPMAYYLQGYNYLKKEEYTPAGDHFKLAIDRLTKPTSSITATLLPDSYLRAGDCLFKRNKYDDAMVMYNKVMINKYSGADYAQYQSAIIQGLKENMKEKLRLLDDLIKKQPGSRYADEALYELAETYSDQDQNEEAIAALKRITKEYSRSNIYNRALIKLGLITYNQGKKQEALVYYKDVFKNNPSPTESQDAQAAIQEIYIDDLGQPDEYIRFIESIPGYNMTNYSKDSLNYSVALRYYEDGNYERAITAFSDYILKFPKGIHLISAFFKRGESNVLLKKYDPALLDYESVLSKGRSEYYEKSIYKAATLAYNYQQNFDKALKYYTELTGITTDENILFEAQLGAMRSAYRKGMTKEVVTYGEQVFKSTKATNDQRSTAAFYLGKIAYDQKNYVKANEYLRTVVQSSDTEQGAESRYLLAQILYLQRSLALAEKATQDAVHQNSDYPYWVAKSMILLSDIFVDKNDLFNARAVLEAVLEHYKDDVEITKTAQSKLNIVKQKQQTGSKLKLDTLKVNSFFERD